MRFVLILLPWLELFTLIELGIKTSALTALVYVAATAVLGMAILRRQGLGIIKRLRQAQSGGMIGQKMLLDDMAMGFAGLLLLLPGMITDLFALVVMIGPLRRRLAGALAPPSSEVYVAQRDAGLHQTLEGEFRRVDDEETRNIL